MALLVFFFVHVSTKSLINLLTFVIFIITSFLLYVNKNFLFCYDFVIFPPSSSQTSHAILVCQEMSMSIDMRYPNTLDPLPFAVI